ncbi:hypothetical protein [Aeromicrobium flavum]|uniref:hypothetical protein n=1 Tax=Aeromicrobium flavum TaxID=416568 RepID=UPI0011BE2519|nr:hypothetical protein [Aeromicrobium flavum]
MAIASVLSSAAIAGCGLVLNFMNGAKQRDHEARQSYEQRAWEQKSGALFGLIRHANYLDDTVTAASNGDPHAWEELAISIPETHDELLGIRPEIVAFASHQCQVALNELLECLRSPARLYDPVLMVRVGDARHAKEAGIDSLNFELAANQRAEERRLLQEAMDGAGVDLVELKARAVSAVNASRASVRGEE